MDQQDKPNANLQSSQDRLQEQARDHLANGNLELARQCLKQMIDNDPEDTWALNKMGVTYAQTKDPTAAREFFERALAIDPEMITALSNMGNTFYDQKRYEEACEYYQKALEIDSKYATARINLAAAYKAMGRVKDSVSEYKKAQRQRARGQASSYGERIFEPPSSTGRSGCLPFGLLAGLLLVLLILAWL